ncbi:MAG: aldo/keto reductase [Cytophagales bacterium]|nr:aldo/keto reductase [Cytophagales bacterium]
MSISKASVSPFIIGAMRIGKWGQQFTTGQMEAFIKDCLELDLKDFDHADIYGDYTTEGDFGKVLQQQPHLREQMRLITKCGIKMVAPNRPDHQFKSYDSSANHIRLSVENSLKYLQTDYLDLLLLHRPDYLLDPEEVAEVFTQLKQEGKVLSFGVSNFSVSQFNLLNDYFSLATNQVEISIQNRLAFDNGVLDQCISKKIIPMAWSPLGGGALFQEPVNDQIKALQDMTKALATKYNAQMDQVLLAWLKKHPSGIIPVLGTSKIDRIKAAKDAQRIQLTHEEWYSLWQAATGEEIA